MPVTCVREKLCVFCDSGINPGEGYLEISKDLQQSLSIEQTVG